MTDKQLEAAAEAMRFTAGSCESAHAKSFYLSMARAAYPHLAQWEEPTEEEITGVLARTGLLPGYRGCVKNDLIELVRRRNAALLPVDPRRSRILEVIQKKGWPLGGATQIRSDEQLADQILAALKEE